MPLSLIITIQQFRTINHSHRPLQDTSVKVLLDLFQFFFLTKQQIKPFYYYVTKLFDLNQSFTMMVYKSRKMHTLPRTNQIAKFINLPC